MGSAVNEQSWQELVIKANELELEDDIREGVGKGDGGNGLHKK